MDREFRNYRELYAVIKPYLFIFHTPHAVGRENIPEGAALVCANHSSWMDPFLMAMALTWSRHICFMTKAELFRKPFTRWLFKRIGSFPVDRGKADLEAIRTTFRLLKAGKKVGIFPEGTRCRSYGDAEPKGGAVRIAEKAGVPILPVYIPRRKPLFRRLNLVIGEPYVIAPAEKKRTGEDYDRLALELMERIESLGRTKS